MTDLFSAIYKGYSGYSTPFIRIGSGPTLYQWSIYPRLSSNRCRQGRFASSFGRPCSLPHFFLGGGLGRFHTKISGNLQGILVHLPPGEVRKIIDSKWIDIRGYPIQSMGMVYLPTFTLKSTIHEGKYTSTMDPVDMWSFTGGNNLT